MENLSDLDKALLYVIKDKQTQREQEKQDKVIAKLCTSSEKQRTNVVITQQKSERKLIRLCRMQGITIN